MFAGCDATCADKNQRRGRATCYSAHVLATLNSVFASFSIAQRKKNEK